MTLYLKLEANHTGTTLLLVDGAVVTGYSWKDDGGAGLGAPAFAPQYSRTVDSVGSRVTGFSVGSRESQIPVKIDGVGATPALRHQSALVYLAALENICDEIRRYGGKAHYRGANATYLTTFPCASAIAGGAHGQELEAFQRCVVALSMILDPFGEAAPLDAFDAFTTNTLGTAGKYNVGGADWTAYAGALTNGVVVGGVVDAAANLSTLNLWAHTGTGRSYQGVQVKLKHTTGATTVGYTAGLSPRIIGADAQNYIDVYVAKASDTLRVDKIVAGVRTNLANVAITALAASTNYWIVARIENNTIHAEHWTAEPTPIGTTGRTATTPYDMTIAEIAQFGRDVPGKVGITWTPIETTASLDDFSILPNTFRSWTLPDVIPVNGSIGGTVAAPTDILFTTTGGTAPVSMLAAWWPKPPPSNMLWNGGGESVGATATVAYGWSAAPIGSIVNDATSVTRTTSAASIRSGAAAIEISVPVTVVNQGAHFPIYQRFKKGVVYTISAYLRAAAGTQTAQIGISGVAGASMATTAAVALSTTYTLHTTTFKPTADLDMVYFFTRTTTAAVQVWQMDDAMVYEGTVAPTFTAGGFGPGILNCANHDQAGASVSNVGAAWSAPTADATHRSGFTIENATTIASGQGYLQFLVLPHLFTPDDYVGDEIDIAVFARCEVGASKVSVNAMLYAQPEGGTGFGQQRFSEFAASGKTLKLPSADAFRPYYLGTVTMRVDRANPMRWKLIVLFTDGAGSDFFGPDYLILVPSFGLCSSQTGVAQDAAFPSFIVTTSETTKRIRSDLSLLNYHEGSSVSKAGYPDGSLLKNRIMLDKGANEVLIWPSDIVIDRTDSVGTANALSHAATVSIIPRPQYSLSRDV